MVFPHRAARLRAPQDKQYLVSFAQLPDGATLDRTEAVIRQMRTSRCKDPGVESGRVPRPVDQRLHQQPQRRHRLHAAQAVRAAADAPDLSAARSCAAAGRSTAGIQDAFIASSRRRRCRAWAPSAASSCRSRTAPTRATTRSTTHDGRTSWPRPPAPGAPGLFSSFHINVPQLYADVDRTKAQQLGVGVQDVFDTLQIYLGSLYVNDFNKFGRTYQVFAQADAPFRAHAEDIGKLKTRNASGQMVPLSSLVTVRKSPAPTAPCATTVSAPPKSTAARARLQHRPGAEGDGGSWPRRCRTASATSGPT
jgi:multidrug efflux pump